MPQLQLFKYLSKRAATISTGITAATCMCTILLVVTSMNERTPKTIKTSEFPLKSQLFIRNGLHYIAQCESGVCTWPFDAKAS
jgi:hypothetical protein